MSFLRFAFINQEREDFIWALLAGTPQPSLRLISFQKLFVLIESKASDEAFELRYPWRTPLTPHDLLGTGSSHGHRQLRRRLPQYKL